MGPYTRSSYLTEEIIASYAAGTILDNLRCQHKEGRIWFGVQQLGGGPRGYVAAEFLKPAGPTGVSQKAPTIRRYAQARANSMQPVISPVRSPSSNQWHNANSSFPFPAAAMLRS